MSLALKILLGADALLLFILVIYVIVRLTKEKGADTVVQAKECAESEEIKDFLTAETETVKTEERVEPTAVFTEDVALTEENSVLTIGDLDDIEDDREAVKRVSFSEKMLTAADDKTKEYYNRIYNKFISYRKVNPRVSSKCLSVRFGKELIAKISVRGRTMTLHLALNANDFDRNVYFQKDTSDVKAYEEVPMSVKVKSDRGLNNAVKLIEILAENRAIEKKARFTSVDALSELTEF